MPDAGFKIFFCTSSLHVHDTYQVSFQSHMKRERREFCKLILSYTGKPMANRLIANIPTIQRNRVTPIYSLSNILFAVA